MVLTGVSGDGADGPAELPALIRDWAARPGSAALLGAVRTKLEHGKTGDGVRVTVPDEHRDDVGRMLGLEWELSGSPVTLSRLRAKLSGAGADLVDLLSAVGGPLRDLPDERHQSAARQQQLKDDASASLTDAGVRPDLAHVAVRRRWLGNDLPTVVTAAEQVARAWTSLPSAPGSGRTGTGRGTGLAEFAGQVLGDPHALDRDTTAGRGLVRLAAASLKLADPTLSADGVDQGADPLDEALAAAANVLSAARWREVWSRVGITCDQVSSTVLLLNVPLEGSNPALAHVSGTRGEPVWVSGRMTAGGCFVAGAATAFLAGSDSADSGEAAGGGLTVLVCENPSVCEAAADSFGAACPPLVCLYGRPSGAAWAVLDAVVSAGGMLLVSTDRDAAGQQIAAEVTSRFGAARVGPWLVEAEGLYEEERLELLLDDLYGRSAH